MRQAGIRDRMGEAFDRLIGHGGPRPALAGPGELRHASEEASKDAPKEAPKAASGTGAAAPPGTDPASGLPKGKGLRRNADGDVIDPDGPEQTICVVRPAMFRAHPFRAVLLVLLFVGGLALAIAGAVKWGEGATWKAAVWGGGAMTLGAVLWWVGWWFVATLCVRLEVTNKRSIRYDGFVRRHSTEVLHDHVRSVDIRQTFTERLFNVGFIGIDSAGQDGIEIEIHDIPAPYVVKETIDAYRAM